MKTKLTSLIAIGICASMIGCAEFQSYAEKALGSPEQFQSTITHAGAIAKPYLSDNVKGTLHKVGETLNTTADLDLNAIYALLPQTTGSILGDLLVANLKAGLSLAVEKWGSNNGTTLAYAHGGGNGLLANF